MSKIVLDQIKKEKETVSFLFSVSFDLAPFFSGREFFITYPFDVSSVPDGILAVPFVCNVLPLVWLTGSELHLPEIDEAFYNSIPDFKNGYIKMYPDAEFKGSVTAEKIVKCDRPAEKDKCAMFYSGGLDSAQTFITHLDEKPSLLAIWGSDIAYNNAKGWALVHNVIKETAARYSLKEFIFRSTFRNFDNESIAHDRFFPVLHDGWWHGVKHSIGLLGHVAPFAYVNNISAMYIGATNCPETNDFCVASHPTIDNFVRFADCKVSHDGFEYNRQDKIRNLVEFCQKTGEKFPLHVCYMSPAGNNCCKCEKCLRTIVALIAENVDPADYGFEGFEKHLHNLKKVIRAIDMKVCLYYWLWSADTIRRNMAVLQKRKEWRHIKWMLKVDFRNPETLETFRQKCAKKIRKFLSQFSFYPKLRRIKRFILRQPQED